MLFSKKNVLIAVGVLVFFSAVYYFQNENLRSNYHDFVDQDCIGIMEKIVVSSVGTKVILQTKEEILFSPEDVPECGFFHNCFSKGDSLIKIQGEDIVMVIKSGESSPISVFCRAF